MKRLLFPIAGLLLAAIALDAASLTDASLWRPRFATPGIVALDSAADRQFVAEVKATPSATGWKASLANDLKTWPCQVTSAVYSKINNATEPGWRITVSVPADISPELFGLAISSSEGTATQRQSVSVIQNFATNFYLLHLSDEQIVNEMHTDPSGQYHHGVGTWEEMKWMQEPINLINPRMVLVTGDQIDFNGALDGWNNWPNWGFRPGGKKHFSKEETLALEKRLSNMYKDCHTGYDVPYVETPGNHDVTPPGKLLSGTKIDWYPISSKFYEQEFGQRSWSFRMGDFYVLMHDWSSQPLQQWAARDYAAASADLSVKYKLIGQHFHAKWDGAPTGNYAFRPASCDLMLIGHGHQEVTIQTSPYYIYEDGASFRYGVGGFFNFKRTGDGWQCEQTATLRNYTNDVWPLFTANGAKKKVYTDQPDVRRITTSAVTIYNDLPQRFYDGRVRFILKKGNYQTVQNGTILAQYDCDNGTKTAVLVRVDIPPKGSVTVTVPSAALRTARR